MTMDWSPSLTEQTPVVVYRVGLLQGELRLFPRPMTDALPIYVLQLQEVASFFDSLPRGVEVRVRDSSEHGSFGWWLPADDPHRSVTISPVGNDSGVFVALARRTIYRISANSEDANWPG
jgi:hypothetical protein